MSNTMNDTMKATRNAKASVKEGTEHKFMGARSLLAPDVALPPWICVVERDQRWRDSRSGVLFEVASVKVSAADAQVRLRTVAGLPGDEDMAVRASVLCAGTGWSRLPDNEGETTAWAGPSRVRSGPEAAGASS